MTTGQRIWLTLAAAGFIVAGTLHFLKPAAYIRIMPPYLPWHAPLVALSGACEILGGVGLFVPAMRRRAAWGLVALLVAVFPANIYMATNPAAAGAASLPPALLWARLPLQLVFIWLLLWSTRPRQASLTPR